MNEGQLAAWQTDLQERERRLEIQEEKSARLHSQLLDSATQQVIALVVLRKMRERKWLNRGDLDELAHGAGRIGNDDYRPRTRLDAILDEKFAEREERKRQASGKLSSS